jgi:hypothetical protein
MGRRGALRLGAASVPAIILTRKDVYGQNTATPAVNVGRSFALAPDYRVNWAPHKTNAAGEAGASVTQTRDGVVLKGGSQPVEDGDNGLAIWSRALTGRNFGLTFRTKKLDDSVPTGVQTDAYLALILAAKGADTSAHPGDLSRWPADTKAFTHYYREYMRGLRLSFYYMDQKDTDEVHGVSAAVFSGDGKAKRLEAPAAPTMNVVRNTTYTWEVRKEGNRITILQDGGASSRVYDDPLIGQFGTGGNIGWLITARRTAEISDFVLASLTD